MSRRIEDLIAPRIPKPTTPSSFSPESRRAYVPPAVAGPPAPTAPTGRRGVTASRARATGATPTPTPAPAQIATPGPDPYRANQDALDTFRQVLSQYGLQSLTNMVFNLMAQGKTEIEIVLEVRKTPEYKTRFPAIEDLRARGRAISENQYVEYERRAVELYRAAGLPTGFYDQPEDFAKLISGEVGLGELQGRVRLAQTASFEAGQDIRNELQRLYGLDPNVSSGALTAHWINPDKALSLLQTQFAAGEIGATSLRTGVGQLTREQAESVAREQLSREQIQTGFGGLGQQRELFLGLPGAGEEEISLEEQLAAAFRGDVQAQERIMRRAKERVAPFRAGGTFATSGEGIVGLGES